MVNKPHHIALVSCKVECLTGIFKLALGDIAEFAVHSSSARFIKGRQVDMPFNKVQTDPQNSRYGIRPVDGAYWTICNLKIAHMVRNKQGQFG